MMESTAEIHLIFNLHFSTRKKNVWCFEGRMKRSFCKETKPGMLQWPMALARWLGQVHPPLAGRLWWPAACPTETSGNTGVPMAQQVGESFVMRKQLGDEMLLGDLPLLGDEMLLGAYDIDLLDLYNAICSIFKLNEDLSKRT